MNDDVHSDQLPVMNFSDFFNIPGKLLSFYQYYVTEAKNILQELDKNPSDEEARHDYQFLIVPTLNKNLTMETVFKEEFPRDRLLVIEFPVYQFYDIQKAQFILLHECSHYVGRNIRLRKSRYYAIVSSIGTYLSVAVFEQPIEGLFEKLGMKVNIKAILKGITDDICYHLDEKFSYFKKEEYLKDCYSDELGKEDYTEENYYYSNPLNRFMEESIMGLSDFMDERVTRTVLQLQDECIRFSIVEEKNTLSIITASISEADVQMKQNKNVCYDALVKDKYVLKKNFNAIYTLREVYADIVAIKLLDLSFKDYVKYLLDDIDDIDEFINDYYLILRFTLCSLMIFKQDDTRNFENQKIEIESYWNDTKDKQNINRLLSHITIFRNKLLEQLRDDITKREDNESNVIEGSHYIGGGKQRKAVIYPAVEIYLYLYLEKCMKELENHITKLKENELKEIYADKLDEKHLYEVIKQMNEIIHKNEGNQGDEYLKEIFDDTNLNSYDSSVEQILDQSSD